MFVADKYILFLLSQNRQASTLGYPCPKVSFGLFQPSLICGFHSTYSISPLSCLRIVLNLGPPNKQKITRGCLFYATSPSQGDLVVLPD